MTQTERTRELLLQHARQYPAMQIQDLFKYIYQSACGCEHAVSSLEAAVAYLQRESQCGVGEQPIVALDGDYSRVPLCYLRRGLSAQTLGKLFYLSAKKEPDTTGAIEQKLAVATALVQEQALAFDLQAFGDAVAQWKAEGYPPMHHSEAFRQAYHPSYRVISNQYLPWLPLLCEIDKAMSEGRTTLAIEGGSVSGKTTLADLPEQIYGCTLFHMDDFYLRPEQRTADRLAESGGNVDRERCDLTIEVQE